uniref:Uncharacterized protein n=1 Tax=Lepeophtheirus salmonis TaxID=72036 RepID=A0A0K2UGQ7_LEPSM
MGIPARKKTDRSAYKIGFQIICRYSGLRKCGHPSSLDCNPLDYFVWGVLKRGSNKRAHNNLASLQSPLLKM